MLGPDLERSLRHELANATDPAPAALELADLLSSVERHREALAVVEAALQRVDRPDLKVCRASLLRDLGQRRQAADALLALARTHGPGAMHPGLLFECAELQWLAGDGQGAAATLQDLEQAHAGETWCVSNRVALDALHEEVTTHEAPPRARVRDLLASLRGAGSVPERIRLLDQLVDVADRETGSRREHLRRHAIAIACADVSPAVRARAVQLAELTPDEAETFCRTALADDGAFVRRFAAERTADCPRGPAIAMLLEAIGTEADAMAFTAMHTALSQRLADGPELATLGADDPATRARIAEAWRQVCSH